jgi:hypothetical protein
MLLTLNSYVGYHPCAHVKNSLSLRLARRHLDVATTKSNDVGL